MNIPVQKLLSKIEDELKAAKISSKEENLREKVYSIKILCELILDEKQTKVEQPLSTTTTKIISQQTFSPPSMINQPKRLEMDDDANGDSLFDF